MDLCNNCQGNNAEYLELMSGKKYCSRCLKIELSLTDIDDDDDIVDIDSILYEPVNPWKDKTDEKN